MFHGILTTGEKIKKLREMYGLKQEALTCTEIKRPMLSLYENDKCTIPYTKAEVLAARFNKLCNVNITADWLLESVLKQAQKKVNENLEKLSDISKEKFLELFSDTEKLILEYELKDSLIKLYDYAINYFFSKSEHKKCNTLLQKNLEMTLQNGSIEKHILYLYEFAKSYLIQKEFKYSLEINKYALFLFKSSKMQDKELLSKIYYNSALALFEEKKFKECLKYIDKYIDIMPNDLDALVLKANILLYTNLDMSLELYFEIIKNYNINIYNYEYLIYHNIGSAYSKIGEFKEAYKYTKMAFEKIIVGDSNYSEILCSCAEIEINLKEYSLAENNLYLALKHSTSNIQKIKIIDMLINIYLEVDKNKIADIITIIETNYDDYKQNENMNKIILKLLKQSWININIDDLKRLINLI